MQVGDLEEDDANYKNVGIIKWKYGIRILRA